MVDEIVCIKNDLPNNILKKGKYRNKSHFLEEAIKFFAKENKE